MNGGEAKACIIILCERIIYVESEREKLNSVPYVI